MALYAIADTHLSFGTDKPMDSFPGWSDYTARLAANWRHLVEPQDTVVIVGDISWAMKFSECTADFAFLNDLPGQKILLKGNHDYWWNTKRKMDLYLQENHFDTLQILHNQAIPYGDVALCGSRGWFFEDTPEAQDEKVLAREVGRIRMSLEAAGDREKIVFLHYPPVTTGNACAPIVELLQQYGVQKCYYGHLHGAAARFAFEGDYQGIDFRLISADHLAFTPLFICK